MWKRSWICRFFDIWMFDKEKQWMNCSRTKTKWASSQDDYRGQYTHSSSCCKGSENGIE